MLIEKFFPVLSASKVTFLIALFKVAPAASDGLTPNNVVAGVVLVVPVALDRPKRLIDCITSDVKTFRRSPTPISLEYISFATKLAASSTPVVAGLIKNKQPSTVLPVPASSKKVDAATTPT